MASEWILVSTATTEEVQGETHQKIKLRAREGETSFYQTNHGSPTDNIFSGSGDRAVCVSSVSECVQACGGSVLSCARERRGWRQ